MRVFIDANVILDKYDLKRPSYKYSIVAYEYLIQNAQIFTSCDLITTIYYLNSKIDRRQALLNIRAINKTLKVIEFSNKEVEETCSLMIKDNAYLELNSDTPVSKEKVGYKDLEDTIQYIMAKKYECDMIISNDKNFVSKDMELMTSEEFCKRFKVA